MACMTANARPGCYVQPQMNAHKQTSTSQARGEQVAGSISLSGDAVEITHHAHPPNNGAGQKASGQGRSPQSRKLCMRQAIGMDDREMNPDDKTESHRGEPERMPKEISHRLRSSRRREQIVAGSRC